MSERGFYSEIEAKFNAFLRALGYPDNSIIFNPIVRDKQGKTCHPDLLIIDPNRNERVAVVEVKGRFPERTQNVKEQLEVYKSAIGDPDLPAYLVVASKDVDSSMPFDLYVVNEIGELKHICIDLFPTFQALISNKIARDKDSWKEEIGSAKSVLHVIAVVIVIIVIADFFCSSKSIILLTTERLWLIGVAVALVIIPYAQKLKILGFEWEKASQKEKRS